MTGQAGGGGPEGPPPAEPPEALAAWDEWSQLARSSTVGNAHAIDRQARAIEAACAISDRHARRLAFRLLTQGVVVWQVAEALHGAPPAHGAPGAQTAAAQFALDVIGQDLRPCSSQEASGAANAAGASAEFTAMLAGIAHGALARCAADLRQDALPGAIAHVGAMLGALERGYDAVADSRAFVQALGTLLAGELRPAPSGVRLAALPRPPSVEPLAAEPRGLQTRPAGDAGTLAAELEGLWRELHLAVGTLALVGSPASTGGSRPEPAPSSPCWRHSGSYLRRLDDDAGPGAAEGARTPLLVVYSLVNHPSVLDLEPGRSLLCRLRDAGYDVYLLDWHAEGETCPERSLDSYVTDLLRPALHAALADAQVASMPVLGVCQGGTLSLCLAALEPQAVSALACMVTPLDFATANDRLARWLRALPPERLAAMDAAAEAVPGELAAAIFRLLNPSRLGSRRYFDMLLNEPADRGVWTTRARLERWLDEAPALGGRALAQFVSRFYQDNAFIEGSLVIDGQAVRSEDIHCPILNIHARHDAIVPPASSAALGQLPNVERYEALALGCGHVGALMGSGALATVPAALRRLTRAPAAG